MCGLFGFSNYSGEKIKDLSDLTNSLAEQSAIRGTDATGIAYVSSGDINIIKDSKPAYRMNFKHPDDILAVMGHTRHSTQGSEKKNYNNHPFAGKCRNSKFAFAHNGVLTNDAELRTNLKLPKTKVQTDSYIGVQIIQSKQELSADVLKYMAQKTEGSFSYSLVDDTNNIWLVKGDTFFSHSMVKDNLTLSSPDEEVRKFWVEHGKCCLKISEYFAIQTGVPCVMNIWIPDGYKDIPSDRLGPRERFKKSLDEILSANYDKSKVYVCLESKVFGIGMESYTVGSSEFCINYVSQKKITPLMDNGHYHPTEVVSDKISAMLLFHEKIALHITRGVRWDSDHVVLFDDETKEIAKEIVRNNALDRVFIATDYFDASVNRISAWVTGMRSVQKALLYALLEPYETFKKLQDENDMTSLMVYQEKLKEAPFGDVWNEYLNREGVSSDYIEDIKKYETDVLSHRK